MNCFEKRCVPVFDFAKLIRVDDSLEVVVRYLESGMKFVEYLVKDSVDNKMPICPFQIDFCMGFDKHKDMQKKDKVKHDSSDDEDEDPDDEEVKKQATAYKYENIIGDIENKLTRNKLKHVMTQFQPQYMTDFEYVDRRPLSVLYRQFLNQYGLDKDSGGAAPQIYLHRKRLIVFVDRRHQMDQNSDVVQDTVWMCEPPPNCREIPHDAVPEWYMNASNTCLLPNMDYGDGLEAQKEYLHKDEEKAKPEAEEKAVGLTKSNICSSFHCKGEVLTLSFILSGSEEMRCYLYWHGEMIKFTPENMEVILPSVINMEWNNGQELKDGETSLNQHFKDNQDTNVEAVSMSATISRMNVRLERIRNMYKLLQKK
eukprot:143822_1